MKNYQNKFNVSEDYYKILEVSENASVDEIERAYRLKSHATTELNETLTELRNTRILLEEILQDGRMPQMDDMGNITSWIPLNEAAKITTIEQLRAIKENIAKLESEIVADKFVEAYTVLTTYRAQYDKARKDYLKQEQKKADEKNRKQARQIYKARQKAMKAKARADKKGISTTENYDEILGVDASASMATIYEAHKEAAKSLNNLSEKRKAFAILSDPKSNKIYHKAKDALGVYDSYKTDENRKLVEKIENGDVPARLSKKAKWIIGGVGLPALAAIIIASTLGLTKHFSSDKQPVVSDSITNTSDYENGNLFDNLFNGKNPGTITEQPTTSEQTKHKLDKIRKPLDDSSNEENNTVTIPGNESSSNLAYGTITNNEDVTTKAQQLLNTLNAAKAFNISTGLPYELEEVKNIILFMNGYYVPEDEQDIYNMYNKYIDFVCVPASSEAYVNYTTWNGGDESKKVVIDESAKTPTYIDIVQAASFENTYGVEYAKWLQDQYYKVLYSTDRTANEAIVNQVFQSFAEVAVGKGTTFNLDGNTYTISSQVLEQKTNVGSASLITYWLYNFKNFVNPKTIQEKSFSVGDNIVFLEELMTYFDITCSFEHKQEASPIGGEKNTWIERFQSNIKAYGYEQLASKGFSFTNTPQQ